MKAVIAWITLCIGLLGGNNCHAAETSRVSEAAGKINASRPASASVDSPAVERLQLGTASSPFVVQKAGDPFDDEEQRLKRRDSWVLAFTFAIAAIALFIAAWQAVMFRRQLVMMREASRDTAVAAKAAMAGAEVSRETLVMAHRAWFGFHDIELVRIATHEDEFQGFQSSAVLKNSGPSPASIQLCQTRTVSLPKGDDGRAILAPGKSPPNVGVGQIGPGAFAHTASELISEAQLKSFFDDTSDLIFWLFIQYVDVFGETRTTEHALRCVLQVRPEHIISGAYLKPDWQGPPAMRWEPFGTYSRMT